ncbi:MAG: hypothetical protein PHN38_06210 [Sulfurospirillaceae bacterium]|nr:hypothetical protein [Sulfurospirillaceae bacterium]MDD3462255.1 hypothetical protein [Sulfurospirillaceae bacterium]
MEIILESILKNDGKGGWIIELKDKSTGLVEICNNLEEYEIKLEAMSAVHGGIFDKITWHNENLNPMQMDDFRQKMTAYQEKYKDALSQDA